VAQWRLGSGLSYSFTVAIAFLAVIYLIDIIATYLLIPEKQGAPP
jgi:hypothetical protein